MKLSTLKKKRLSWHVCKQIYLNICKKFLKIKKNTYELTFDLFSMYNILYYY